MLNITRYGAIGNSIGTRLFLSSLVVNSLLSFAIVFALIFVLGYFISERMSRDLMQTAQQAVDIDLGREETTPQSNVQEIKTIQQSLAALRTRLKLKQTSRKQLVDELVHQTRTPLTILKTHLEGFLDGIIRFTPEEVQVCDAQIDNISSIIANMSGLIDAEREIDTISIEQIELSSLVRQIIAGLKAQFDKKGVALTAATQKKIVVRTDPYKLSQAIYNLLTNAYKFTEPGGSVHVEYRLEGGLIAIKRNGHRRGHSAGGAAAHLRRILPRRQRSADDRRRHWPLYRKRKPAQDRRERWSAFESGRRQHVYPPHPRRVYRRGHARQPSNRSQKTGGVSAGFFCSVQMVLVSSPVTESMMSP